MAEPRTEEKARSRSLIRFVAEFGSLIVVMVPISAALHWAGTPGVLRIALYIAVGWAWPNRDEWPFNRIGRDRDA